MEWPLPGRGPRLWNNWAMLSSNAPTALPVDPDEPQWRYHDNFGTAHCPEDTNPTVVLARYLTHLRQRHPALRQTRYGNDLLDDNDVSYLFAAPAGGHPVDGDRAVRVHIDGSGIGDVDLLMLFNTEPHQVRFAVPAAQSSSRWRRVIDTAHHAEPDSCCWPESEATIIDDEYVVAGLIHHMLRIRPWTSSTESR